MRMNRGDTNIDQLDCAIAQGAYNEQIIDDAKMDTLFYESWLDMAFEESRNDANEAF